MYIPYINVLMCSFMLALLNYNLIILFNYAIRIIILICKFAPLVSRINLCDSSQILPSLPWDKEILLAFQLLMRMGWEWRRVYIYRTTAQKSVTAQEAVVPARLTLLQSFEFSKNFYSLQIQHQSGRKNSKHVSNQLKMIELWVVFSASLYILLKFRELGPLKMQ